FDVIYSPSTLTGQAKMDARCAFSGDTLARVHQLRYAPVRGYRHLSKNSTENPFSWIGQCIYKG
ncbi:hypothetical protein, partial [Methylomagnum sp.]